MREAFSGQPSAFTPYDGPRAGASPPPACETRTRSPRAACFACGGALIEIRGKLQCRQCGRICETCCEGGVQ